MAKLYLASKQACFRRQTNAPIDQQTLRSQHRLRKYQHASRHRSRQKPPLTTFSQRQDSPLVQQKRLQSSPVAATESIKPHSAARGPRVRPLEDIGRRPRARGTSCAGRHPISFTIPAVPGPNSVSRKQTFAVAPESNFSLRYRPVRDLRFTVSLGVEALRLPPHCGVSARSQQGGLEPCQPGRFRGKAPRDLQFYGLSSRHLRARRRRAGLRRG
jgi:hypothetical protein